MIDPQQIEIFLKLGSGKAVYFADVKIAAFHTALIGCAVWNGKPDKYKLSYPAKPGAKGKYFPCVEVSPELDAAIQAALHLAIKKFKQASGSQPAP